FVVTYTTGIDTVPLDRGFKWRRAPETERVRRLHVIVTVDQERWFAWRAQPFAVHHGMSRRVEQFDAHRATELEPVCNPDCSGIHIGTLCRVGTDAGDTKKFQQLLHHAVVVSIEVVVR